MNALLLAFVLLALPQAPSAPAAPPSAVAAETDGTPAELFTLAESAIRSADIPRVATSFGRQIYVSLKGGESGYFSANQASSVLQSFFSSRRPLTFTFSTVQGEGEPFATGSGTFLVKGTRETLQVYVAATRQGNRWVISQFNVY